jgi:molecular chaperone GrpE
VEPLPLAAENEALRERISCLEAGETALKEEISALKDQYLRKLADDDNYRKRMRREMEDARKFANSALLGDLVTVLDDFGRAIASSEHSQDFTVLHDGVSLIQRQFSQMLANKYGLISFEATGDLFDPNIHEALASEPGDVEEATVAEAFLPGYRLHDRVIRSAKVKVATPRPKSDAGAAGAGQGSDEKKE